jgi:hypothetical protein
MSFLHHTDIPYDFFPLDVVGSSGEKAVKTIGYDFRLPVLMQQRKISFHGHRNLSDTDLDF